MSDIHRIRATPAMRSAGIITLARMTHDAEEAEDDVTFLGIQDAVASRPWTEQRMYREAYLEQWKKRMDARKKHGPT